MSTQTNPATIAFQVPGLMLIAKAISDEREKEVSELSQFARDVLLAIPFHPGALTRSEIASITGFDTLVINSAMESLRVRGYMQSTPRSGRAQCKYWRVK